MIGRVSDSGANEIPIFELGLAIVPGERVPLHIFEQRYRLMMAHCLEGDEPFGIVLRDDGGARSIGCSAEITEVTERHEDGRMDIVVTGAEPFSVLDRFEAPDWPAASIAALDTDWPSEDCAEELGAARAAFAEEAALSAYAIAAQVEMPPAEKQSLLEAPGERERLTSLEATLRRLLAGVSKSRELGERAKTNGHAPGRIGPIQGPGE